MSNEAYLRFYVSYLFINHLKFVRIWIGSAGCSRPWESTKHDFYATIQRASDPKGR